MLKKTVARKFLEFAEEIQDPNFDISTLEDTEEFDEPEVEVADNEATISLPEEDGSAVTVVTPKGTSVSVTETLAKAFLASSWFKPICESILKYNKTNESAGGANFAFSNADINDFYNGKSLDDIIARRISKSWNEPQGVKNAFGGSVNEDFDEESEETTSGEEGFFAEEDGIPEVVDTPITADLSVEGDKIVIDNIELKDKVEENPELDTPTRDEEEEKDEIVVGDPIGEALQAARDFRKDASISNKVEDADKPVLRVQTTNGVINKKKVQEQPENKE